MMQLGHHSSHSGGDGAFDPNEFLAALRTDRPISPALVQHLRTKWRRIAGRRGYPHWLVEDAISDTWVRILTNWRQVKSPCRLEAWTNQVFINCVHDRLRAGRSSGVESIEDCRQEPQDRGASPEELLCRSQALRPLRRAVAALTPTQRQVFLLYIVRGHSAAVVAGAVDRTAERVRHIGMEVRRRLIAACGTAYGSGSLHTPQ
jgi:RNA polymerase sigma factor (sigma-70 family)